MKKKLVRVLVILLGVLVILLVIGMLAGNSRHSSSINVNAPKDYSWEVLQNPELMPNWLAGFKSIEVVEGSPGEIGTRYKLSFQQGGETVDVFETIERMEPPNVFAYTIESDFLEGQVQYELSFDSGVTTIESQTNYKGKGPLKNLLLLMAGSNIRDQEKQNIERLKKLIESEFKSEDVNP